MTRKEEILQASVKYNAQIGKLNVIGGDSLLNDEEFTYFNQNPSFIAGAEWADKTLLDKVKELLLSKVLPMFMHGADEVIAELDKAMEE